VDILLAEIDVYELFAFKHCVGRKVQLALCKGMVTGDHRTIYSLELYTLSILNSFFIGMSHRTTMP
jgi:hypothetical protein